MQPFSEFVGLPNSAAPHQGPLTVSNTAVTLLSLLSGGALHDETRFVQLCIEDADVRLTVTGTTPTTTLGRKLLQDSAPILSRGQADACRLIRAAGTDVKLQVIQYIN